MLYNFDQNQVDLLIKLLEVEISRKERYGEKTLLEEETIIKFSQPLSQGQCGKVEKLYFDRVLFVKDKKVLKDIGLDLNPPLDI